MYPALPRQRVSAVVLTSSSVTPSPSAGQDYTERAAAAAARVIARQPHQSSISPPPPPSAYLPAAIQSSYKLSLVANQYRKYCCQLHKGHSFILLAGAGNKVPTVNFRSFDLEVLSLLMLLPLLLTHSVLPFF